VYERLADPSALFVQHILPPAAIRGLTARATIVITGRMHLAIMALYHGVPAITLGTQGKVEGLMQMLDASFLCVEPNAGFGERVTAVALESLRRRAELSAQIAARVALIRERSRLNFPQ
jgi:polysaccharide pyruvyl transferase WcaK-like protein